MKLQIWLDISTNLDDKFIPANSDLTTLLDFNSVCIHDRPDGLLIDGRLTNVLLRVFQYSIFGGSVAVVLVWSSLWSQNFDRAQASIELLPWYWPAMIFDLLWYWFSSILFACCDIRLAVCNSIDFTPLHRMLKRTDPIPAFVLCSKRARLCDILKMCCLIRYTKSAVVSIDLLRKQNICNVSAWLWRFIYKILQLITVSIHACVHVCQVFSMALNHSPTKYRWVMNDYSFDEKNNNWNETKLGNDSHFKPSIYWNHYCTHRKNCDLKPFRVHSSHSAITYIRDSYLLIE